MIRQTRTGSGAAGARFAAMPSAGGHSGFTPFQENNMTEFLVEGMSCGHCVNVVTEAIHALDPAASVDVNLGTKLVRVHSDLDRFLLSQALVDAGYDPVLVGLQMPDHI
jgi:copper chaperone